MWTCFFKVGLLCGPSDGQGNFGAAKSKATKNLGVVIETISPASPLPFARLVAIPSIRYSNRSRKLKDAVGILKNCWLIIVCSGDIQPELGAAWKTVEHGFFDGRSVHSAGSIRGLETGRFRHHRPAVWRFQRLWLSRVRARISRSNNDLAKLLIMRLLMI